MNALTFKSCTSRPGSLLIPLLLVVACVFSQAARAHAGAFCTSPNPAFTVGGVSSLTLDFEAGTDELELYRAVLTLPAGFTFNGFTALGGLDAEVGRQTVTVGGITILDVPLRVYNADIAYMDINDSGDRDGGDRFFIDPLLTHTLAGNGDHVFTLIAHFGGDADPETHHVVAASAIQLVLDTGILTAPASGGPYTLTGAFTSIDPDTDGADDGVDPPPVTCNFALSYPALEVVRTDPPNLPPVAQCMDVTVAADANCMADASVDNASYDPEGDPVTLAQVPPGPYVPGSTNVTLGVTDSLGAVAACTATVTVTDDTPPTLTCPDDVVTPAISASGATVSFVATTSDNCPGVSYACTPASDSLFAIGTTPVDCSAQDSAGNQAVCGFSVQVLGAGEQLEALLALVRGLGLPRGRESSLVRKLEDALDLLVRGNTRGACRKLGDFDREVSAQRDKDIPAAAADTLLAESARIRGVIGC